MCRDTAEPYNSSFPEHFWNRKDMSERLRLVTVHMLQHRDCEKADLMP